MNEQAYASLNQTTIQAVLDHCKEYRNTIVEPVSYNKTLHETLEVLRAKKLTAIPVKKLEIIGIVSIADILNFILFSKKSDNVPIESMLGATEESSTNFILSADTTIYVLIQLFTGQDYHHRALIKDEAGEINMITQSDLMSFIYKNFKESFNLPITRACRLYVRNPQLADPIGESNVESPAVKKVITVQSSTSALDTFSDLELLNVADVHVLSKNILDFFNTKRALSTCTREDDVNTAVKMMLGNEKDRIWVVDELKPVDIVTVTDILCLMRPNINL
ncbi:hypothetical protein HDV06_005190 [Boothiomyces sp. JEL0866]|nr:hypothetical protein HDV06_005190 [Boothiomyces sp. JEL0866]